LALAKTVAAWPRLFIRVNVPYASSGDDFVSIRWDDSGPDSPLTPAKDFTAIKGKDFEMEIAGLKPGTRVPVDYTRGSSAHEIWITVGSQN